MIIQFDTYTGHGSFMAIQNDHGPFILEICQHLIVLTEDIYLRHIHPQQNAPFFMSYQKGLNIGVVHFAAIGKCIFNYRYENQRLIKTKNLPINIHLFHEKEITQLCLREKEKHES